MAISSKGTDLEGEPIIDALAENVQSTTRGTVIAKGDASVSTEHALAALYAAGIDNCLIKIDGPKCRFLTAAQRNFVKR